MPADAANSLSQTGVVRAIDGDSLVVAVAAEGCSGCGKRSGCGIGKLVGGARQSLVRVAAPACADGAGAIRVGDDVLLTADADAVHRAAFITYLLPAVLLAAGTVAGDVLLAGVTGRDAGSALGALAGLVAGLAFASWKSRRQGGADIAVRRVGRR